METLKLEITAENRAAVASLKETTAQLDAVSKASVNTTTKLSNLTKGSNQANMALTNLGRVAQDAPFGFIGIQNNLNPLLESFQRLKAETGSTGGALKALGSSLMGAGGIGFALSAASALFLVFGDSMMKAGHAAEVAQKTHEDFADSISKATGNASAEVAQLSALVNVINNTTESTETRKRALDQLKKTYEGNVELQKIDINDAAKLATVIGQISDAIMRKARVTAFASLIAEEEAKVARLQQSNANDLTEKVSGLSKAWLFLKNSVTTANVATMAGATVTDMMAAGVDKVNVEVAQANKNISTYKGLLNQTTAEQIKFNDAAKIGDKGAKAAKIDYGPAEYLFAKNAKVTNPREKQKTRTDLGTLQAPQQFMADNTEMMNMIAASKALQTENNSLNLYNQYIAESIQLTNMASQAFTDLGNALLQGQSIGDALGNVFKKLAADIAAAAVKALIFQAILAAVSGGTSTAVGAAAGKSAPGFGKLFAGFLGLGKGFAEGGIATGPKSGHLQLLHGTEAIFPMDKLGKFTDRAMGMGAAMASQSNSRSVNINGQFKVLGNDLVYVLNKANYSLNVGG